MPDLLFPTEVTCDWLRSLAIWSLRRQADEKRKKGRTELSEGVNPAYNRG